MVVFEPENEHCTIYEIKHSSEINTNQYRHIIDKDKCDETQLRFCDITGKYVIYRGKTFNVDGVQYLNVEDYLR